MAAGDWKSAWGLLFNILLLIRALWLGLFPLQKTPLPVLYIVEQAVTLAWAHLQPDVYIRYRWALIFGHRLIYFAIGPIRQVRPVACMCCSDLCMHLLMPCGKQACTQTSSCTLSPLTHLPYFSCR